MPVQTRAMKRRHNNRKPANKSRAKPKPKAVKPKPKPKRRLTEKAKSVGTPPNKKKKTNRNRNRCSPSKALAQCVSKLQLTNDSESDSHTDTDTSDYEQKDESENTFEEMDRNSQIIALQERLLTQDTNYKLIGRETEYAQISLFLQNKLKSNTGDSFYICGSPGTGKSATIQNICDFFMSPKSRKKYRFHKIIKINGMSVHNPSDIYSIIYQQINPNKNTHIRAMDARDKLEKYFLNRSSQMYTVIIDEMDGLLTNQRKESILYNLFGWAKRKHSKLILFGIANSIDLTDRFLPRLRQRELEPELLIFKPYTKSQLIEIVSHRLGKDQCLYFEDISLKLCAQKVAKMYGDVRKLLEIVRNALNILLVSEDSRKKIGFMEMKQILSSSFESPVIDIIRDLPNQQKTILVMGTILMNSKVYGKGTQKVLIYNKFQSFSQFMAKKYILSSISGREFNTIIDSLIADNIIKIVNGNKRGGKGKCELANHSQLQIMCKREDIQFAVKNDELLNKFFQINVVVPSKFRS